MADEHPLFESGDLVVSVKRLHLVFVFDPDAMEVKWHTSDPFITQHDPDFIGDGWIAVFDNQDDGTGRGSVLGGNRIVAVQPRTDSTKVLFPTEHSEPFYTGSQGRWELLDHGNTRLTETESGRISRARRWDLCVRRHNSDDGSLSVSAALMPPGVSFSLKSAGMRGTCP